MEQNKLKLACFDADFIPFYVCNNKKGEDVKTLKDCLLLCDNIINNINNILKVDSYIGFLTKGKCFRYAINPDYKAKRKYDNLPEFLPEVRNYMQEYHNFSFVEGYEADDLVVSFKKQNPIYDVIIVSPDKDILMSVDIAFNPRKFELVKNNSSKIDYNFWEQMVKGDQVDGIKGIPGKGEAYFRKIADKYYNSDNYDRDKWYTLVLLEYVNYFGEYEGIKEFNKNYLSLKMVDNVELKNIKINEIKKD